MAENEIPLSSCQPCRFRRKEDGGNGECYLLRNGALKTYEKMVALPYHNCLQFKKGKPDPPPVETLPLF